LFVKKKQKNFIKCCVKTDKKLQHPPIQLQLLVQPASLLNLIGHLKHKKQKRSLETLHQLHHWR